MFFFFQAEDGIRDLVRSRGLGDVYKRQVGGDAAGPTVTTVTQNRTLDASGATLDVLLSEDLSLIHI